MKKRNLFTLMGSVAMAAVTAVALASCGENASAPNKVTYKDASGSEVTTEITKTEDAAKVVDALEVVSKAAAAQDKKVDFSQLGITGTATVDVAAGATIKESKEAPFTGSVSTSITANLSLNGGVGLDKENSKLKDSYIQVGGKANASAKANLKFAESTKSAAKLAGITLEDINANVTGSAEANGLVAYKDNTLFAKADYKYSTTGIDNLAKSLAAIATMNPNLSSIKNAKDVNAQGLTAVKYSLTDSEYGDMLTSVVQNVVTSMSNISFEAVTKEALQEIVNKYKLVITDTTANSITLGTTVTADMVNMKGTDSIVAVNLTISTATFLPTGLTIDASNALNAIKTMYAEQIKDLMEINISKSVIKVELKVTDSYTMPTINADGYTESKEAVESIISKIMGMIGGRM